MNVQTNIYNNIMFLGNYPKKSASKDELKDAKSCNNSNKACYSKQRTSEYPENVQISSANLYHHFKKGLYNSSKLYYLSNAIDENEGYLGCLPKDWIDKIDPSEIGEKTKEIQMHFAEFAKIISKLDSTEYRREQIDMVREFRKIANNKGCSKEETNILVSKLEEQLQTCTDNETSDAIGSLEEKLAAILDCDCHISLIGDGSYGRVFKVVVDDKAYALKTFKPGMRSLLGQHGKMVEIANSVCSSNDTKPSQSAKFYFGKFAKYNQLDEYMVTGFVDSSKGNSRGIWDYDKYSVSRYIVNDSNEDNTIDGKLIDFGGVIYRFQNEEQRNIAKELYPLLKAGDFKGVEALREKYGNSKDFLTVLNRAL